MSENNCYTPKVARRSASQRIRGVDYHLSMWGNDDDPLLLFAHGWGDAGSCFQFVVDEMQQRYRVIAPDWRGFGERDGAGAPDAGGGAGDDHAGRGRAGKIGHGILTRAC